MAERPALSTPNRRGDGREEVTCTKQQKFNFPIPEGFTVVFRPWITLKNGKRLYASQIGKRAFPLLVPVSKA